jgi:hypothetical protein
MTAVKKFLAGGAVVAALVTATPASAQYFPGSGYGGGDILGQILGSIIGGGAQYGSPYGSAYGGYGSPYGYGMGYGSPYGGGYGSPYGGGYGSPYGGGYGSPYGGQGNGGYASSNSYAVGQCMGAVQQRLGASYGQSQYGGGARVLGVSDVQPRNNGGMLVSGVANSGRTGAYGYNGGQPPVDITFTCKTDRSGQVSSIEIGQATANVDPRIGAPVTSPYATDYSQYGYRRY